MQPQLLKGIKIIDFTRLLPGPLATHILSQMGAEVIKIEHPDRMDHLRYFGKQVDGASTIFHAINHLKTLKRMDYHQSEERELLFDWIKTADVLIEQFRPGVMDSWGLGFEELRAINPQLVYVSLTGYGSDNDKQHEAGHDINYLAYSGLLSLMKDGHDKPVLPGFQIADIGGGSYATVMAVQAGIIHRLNQQKGCQLEVSMTQSILPLLTFPLHLEWSDLPSEYFNILNGNTLVNYALYQCADQKWIALGALELKFWNNFCDVLQLPHWKQEKQEALSVHVFPREEVEALFRQKTRDDWIDFFEGKDVCIAPVLELGELELKPYFNQINAFQSFQTHSKEKLKTIGLPFFIKKQ